MHLRRTFPVRRPVVVSTPYPEGGRNITNGSISALSTRPSRGERNSRLCLGASSAAALRTRSARSSSPGLIVCSRSEVDRDVLRLQVLVDPLVAALAADAGLLDAAERRAGVGDHALIEADHPGLQALADAERPLEVAGEDVGDEPVLGVVGGRDRLLLGRE